MNFSELKLLRVYAVVAFIPLLAYTVPDLASQLFVSKGIMNILSDIPYLGFGAVAFMGYRLNQARILISSILMFISYLLLQHINTGELKTGLIGNQDLIRSLALSIPLVVLIVLTQKESRIRRIKTIARYSLSLLPLGFFVLLNHVRPEAFQWLVHQSVFPTPWFKLPQLTVLSYGVLVSGLFWISDRKIGLYVVAMMIAMVPCLTAFQVSLVDGLSERNMNANIILAYSAVAGILVDAMFRMYWQRVYLDELTGIPNRRALDEFLYTLEGDYTIGMIDIDHFKKFNDSYGHDEGDNVLRLVGKTLHGTPKVRVYRYGGEEFCAIYEGGNSEDSFIIANKMRRTVDSLQFVLRTTKNQPSIKHNLVNLYLHRSLNRHQTISSRDSDKGAKKPRGLKSAGGTPGKRSESKSAGGDNFIKISISMGLASPNEQAPTPYEVIKLADKALYDAKHQGRNKVVIAS